MKKLQKLDPEILDSIKNLMQDKFSNLVDRYIKTATTYIENAETAFQTRNIQALADAVHPLKASSGNLGAIKLHNISEKIENVANDAIETKKDIDHLGPLVSALRPEFMDVKKELKHVSNI